MLALSNLPVRTRDRRKVTVGRLNDMKSLEINCQTVRIRGLKRECVIDTVDTDSPAHSTAPYSYEEMRGL